MNLILIAVIVIVVILVIIAIYHMHEVKSVIYTTSVNSTVMYEGSSKPYIASNDSDRIVVAHGNTVDVFTEKGMKISSGTINEVRGVAYNSCDEIFMAIDSNGNLYSLDDLSEIGSGYTMLYDTVGGYYAQKGGIEIVTGDSSSKTPINGSYGMFDVITKVGKK